MLDSQPTLKYCLYARKSSESDERQAMSIDSQLAEMRALAENEGLNVVDELQESYSAKDSGQRPIYNQLLQGIRDDKYDAILTWAPDRLSRNAGDLGAVVDLMDQGKLLHIRTYSQTFTNNPNEKFLLMILCSQAKLENDNKSINVKRGIRTKCEMGWRPGVAPLGYINRAFGGVKDIIPDPERYEMITEMFRRAGQENWSGRRLKSWLDEENFTNRAGKKVTLSQILVMLKNPFYYGEFQYPEEPDGKWYKGAHKPLISKELFELVQETRGLIKGKWGQKQFAFRGLLECGTCGAGVTGEDKFKRIKSDGSVRRYVYYRCTKKKDSSCPEKYIGEVELTKVILQHIEESGDDIKISSNLRALSERYTAMMKTMYEYHKTKATFDAPLIEYARYVLKRGTEDEKRALAKGIVQKLLFSEGSVSIKEEFTETIA